MQKKTFPLDVASQTVQGPNRNVNGDSLLTVLPQDTQVMDRKGALLVVADGSLGSRDLNNQITVDTIEATYYQESNQTIVNALVQALQQANVRLFQRIEALRLEWEGDSTCTAVVLCGDALYGAHVGQSRAYLVRQGQIKQLTQDHTWVGGMVHAGQLQPQEQQVHPRRNIVTRTLGGSSQPDTAVDTFSESVQSGDYLVLCTDGLWHLMEDEEIAAVVEQGEPQQSVQRLIQLANERARRDDMLGEDDMTIIVVKITL